MYPQPSKRLSESCKALYDILCNTPGTTVRESVSLIRLPENSSFFFNDQEGTPRRLVGLHFSMDHCEAFPVLKYNGQETELFYGEFSREHILESVIELTEHFKALSGMTGEEPEEVIDLDLEEII